MGRSLLRIIVGPEQQVPARLDDEVLRRRERLIEKRIPDIEGKSHGHGAVGRQGLSQDSRVSRFAAHISNVRWVEPEGR